MKTMARTNIYDPSYQDTIQVLKCAIFIVECLVSVPTGNYALYTASSGRKVWTRNYGYQPGDEVWVYYQEGAKKPEQILVNGKEIVITE